VYAQLLRERCLHIDLGQDTEALLRELVPHPLQRGGEIGVDGGGDGVGRGRERAHFASCVRSRAGGGVVERRPLVVFSV
jgi:hypothetical protein